jgi:plastocyanin
VKLWVALSLVLAVPPAALSARPDSGVAAAQIRPVPTGAVRGRVEIEHPLPPIERAPAMADMDLAPRGEAAQRTRAVVYLEDAPQPAFEDRGNLRAHMDQQHETFVPHVLAITVGTTVDFPNVDVTFHNVFSLSKAKRFDLGRYAAGRSKSVLFDEPGIVRVFCEIHSHMSAFILVFAHRFYAITDEEGRYHIDRVPPGTYTVTAWYEAVAQVSRSVTIPDTGGPIELDFTIR